MKCQHHCHAFLSKTFTWRNAAALGTQTAWLDVAQPNSVNYLQSGLSLKPTSKETDQPKGAWQVRLHSTLWSWTVWGLGGPIFSYTMARPRWVPYVYIYIYVCVCVCIYIYMCVFSSKFAHVGAHKVPRTAPKTMAQKIWKTETRQVNLKRNSETFHLAKRDKCSKAMSPSNLHPQNLVIVEMLWAK